MFRGHLEQPARVTPRQLLDVRDAPQGQVHADPGGDKDLFHAGLPPGLPHQLDERPVIRVQQAQTVG